MGLFVLGLDVGGQFGLLGRIFEPFVCVVNLIDGGEFVWKESFELRIVS